MTNSAESAAKPGLRDAEQEKQQHGKVQADRDEGEFERELFDEGFTPLSRDEAQKFRKANPQLSPWGVVAWQFSVGVLVAVVAWMLTGRQNVALSAFYGSLAVAIPAALFARGLSRQQQGAPAGALLMGFVVWEAVKVGLTLAMLFAAPRLITDLNWLALLAGFVVTMKVYWVAMWLRVVRKSR